MKRAAALFLATALAAAPAKHRVIFDQDTQGVCGTNAYPLLMFLQADDVELLGVTVATGNGWLKQELADVLKTLERMGRPDIPVYPGAEFPLVQTREEMLLRARLYGGHRLDPYLGAYAENHPGPEVVVEPKGGFAKIQPQKEPAAEFIIRAIRQNPGQVTLYCGGALTNVALAIRLAPDIVPLTKELFFMGAGIHEFAKTVNVIYDPEAARIVLRAPWPKLTLVTVDLAEKAHMNQRIVDAVLGGGNPAIAGLFRDCHGGPRKANEEQYWFRMPDEMLAAAILDPSLFPEARRMYVDIDITGGMHYGASMFWDETPHGHDGAPWNDFPGAQKPLPPPGARLVNVLWDVDVPRFEKFFIELMRRPPGKK